MNIGQRLILRNQLVPLTEGDLLPVEAIQRNSTFDIGSRTLLAW